MAQAPLSATQLRRHLKLRPASKEPRFEITFEQPTQPPKPGIRVFPAPIEGTLIKRPAHSHKRASSVEFDESKLDGFLPEHLALNPFKPLLDARFKRGKFFRPAQEAQKGRVHGNYYLSPDQRYVFSDTSFPWCTTGRVDVTGGWGSGVLIGPRHLMCASHMMTWNPDNTVNQVTFTPSYFDGNAPFGNSGIIHWYAYQKVVGPNLNGSQIDEDYVVLVLSNRLGDVCGWMGTRGYADSWNGLADWSHIGYPGDLTGGARPTFQNGISVNSTAGNDPTDEELFQQADVWPGQSGGPFFGWWSGEPWPRVVGIQSAQNPQTNLAGGGNDIPNLVSQARSDFP